MATAREEAKQRKRKEILSAAAHMMAEVGFARVRLGDVGAAVGISGPGLYRYFASKEVLLSEILIDISTRLLDGAIEIINRHKAQGGADPVTVIGELIDFHVDTCINEPDHIRVQERERWNLVEVDSAKIRSLQRSYMNLWTDILQQAEPELDRATARMRVQLTAGLIASSRYVHHWADHEQLRDLLRGMARNAIGVGARDSRG